MFRTFLKRVGPLRFGLAAAAAAYVGHNVVRDEQTCRPHLAAGFNYSRRDFPASAEYPDLKRHKNIMARCLSQELYARLRDRRTQNGFTVDDAIQTGVDNSGKFSFTGVVAGDEDSYQVFRELFDKVIEMKHGFKPDQRHPTDFDVSKLHDAVFDSKYVESIRIRTLRNIRGYCLPSFCTRGERREVESIVVQALTQLSQYRGMYFSFPYLSKNDEQNLSLLNVDTERPFLPTETASNFARDWPDSRGIWLSIDKTLGAYVNRKDHVLLSITAPTADFQATAAKFFAFVRQFQEQIAADSGAVMKSDRLGFLTTDPANVGTALKMSVRVRLPLLSRSGRLPVVLRQAELSQQFNVIPAKDGGLDDNLDEPPYKEGEEDAGDQFGTLEVYSYQTLGRSEVQLAQRFVDSINKLVELEKRLEAGESIDNFFN